VVDLESPQSAVFYDLQGKSYPAKTAIRGTEGFHAHRPGLVRKEMKVLAVILCGFLLLSNAGCALMVSGSRQRVELSAAPSGTQVSVYRWNGELVARGVSPGELEIPRPGKSQPYLVRSSMDGYCPRYVVTK
jgi:hypothetical protein